jgi:hypothetical protein
MENETQNTTVNTDAGAKERVVLALTWLIELIQNDRRNAAAIEGLTVPEILELAEAEAIKAGKLAGDLARPHENGSVDPEN